MDANAKMLLSLNKGKKPFSVYAYLTSITWVLRSRQTMKKKKNNPHRINQKAALLFFASR